ncbi:MAG TPA: SGNH/GDSL hydrolase family protein [Vicinamibacterales bacterium]|jgi:lysophospholipase L1-like esterase|nr:SGNH/GDSL hydrolase family protein [Vicinamibacterales bacterium]
MTLSTPPPLSRAAELLIAGLAAGVLASCGGGQDSGASPSPTPAPGVPIVYAAIGASDAIGYGSSAPCVPFTACPDGRGYVPLATRELGEDGSTVTLTNLGIPGAVLSPTIQGIGNQYGRGIQGNFLEQEMPFVPRASTLVTVFAGGNDTNAIGTAVDRGAGGADPNGYIDGQVRTFANDYAALVRGIRQRAPTARIVAMNLPNFAGLPYTARFTSAQKRYMQRISVGFSREGANALAAEGVVVVDLLCDPRSYQSSNYSSDGFHPNDAGYAFMAAELVRAIRTAGYPPPQDDCSFTRIVG